MTQLKNKTTLYTDDTIAYFHNGDPQVPNLLACGLGVQALIKYNETQLIDKLISYITGAPSSQSDQWWWMSGEQIGHFIFALESYTSTRSSSKSSNLKVTLTDINGRELGTISDIYPSPIQLLFEDIPNGVINYEASVHGQGFILFGADFVPPPVNSTDKDFDKGISVDRIIQLIDPKTNLPTGNPLSSAQIGDMVVTTIEIILRDYSSGIKVVDYYPGALVPLKDFILAPYSPPYLDWFYSEGAFSQIEFHLNKVLFYGSNLLPGTYVLRYYAIVNFRGNFTYPSTVAYDIFRPEVMGASRGGFYFSTYSFVKPDEVEAGNCIPWENRQVPDLGPYIHPSIGTETTQQNNSVGWGVGLTFLFLILLVVGILIYKYRVQVNSHLSNIFKLKKEDIHTL
jgi:hypothetical protein